MISQLRSRKQTTIVFLLVLLAAFALRVHYRSNAVDEYPYRADARQYFVIAINLVNYGVFSSSDATDGPPAPDSYRGPLYPLAIAGFLQGAGSDDPAGVAYGRLLFWQAVIGALTAALTFLLGRLWLPWGWALAAALLCATWPLLITLSALALTETLFGGLLMLAVGLQVVWQRTGTWLPLVACGLAWSACILLNAVALPLPVLLGLLVSAHRPYRLLLFLAIALAPQALWSVRNAMVTEGQGRMTLSSRLLENVLIGMEPDFNDRYQRPDEPQGYASLRRVQELLDAHVQGKQPAIAVVGQRLAQEPAVIVAHFLTKPWEFWRWDVQQGHGGPYVYRMLISPFESSPLYLRMAALTQSITPWLFALTLVPCIALMASRRRREWAWEHRGALLVVVVVLYATVVHTLLTPDARYAAPFRPFQFLIAAWGGWMIVEAGRSWFFARRSTAARGHGPVAVEENQPAS
jgi:4-amino-4-deoxy-L-arabinose transferase-like glycosyltransferase